MQSHLPLIPSRAVRFFCFALIFSWLGACAHVHFVADFDAQTLEETIRVAREVDLFYARLLEVPVTARSRERFIDAHIEIEADIRALLRRNTARALNEESRAICAQILTFWIAYREKLDEAYSDAEFDRDRFTRLFNAAASAEEAKRLPANDRS